MSSIYFDYRFKFTDLTRALGAMTALHTAGVLGTGRLPENMLGDLRDVTGNVVSEDLAVWGGRKGGDGGTDPASWYVHIRSVVDPASLPFDPTSFGLVVTDPVESGKVLGVWA